MFAPNSINFGVPSWGAIGLADLVAEDEVLSFCGWLHPANAAASKEKNAIAINDIFFIIDPDDFRSADP